MTRGWALVVGLVLGMALGIAGPRYAQRAWARYVDTDCQPTTVVKLSPDGMMKATLTTKSCDYGFGFAAGFANVRIDKKDPNGWFMNESLDVDLLPKVAIAWRGPDFLEADVVSREFSGSLEQHVDGFSFLQRYVSPQTSTDPRATR